MTVCHLEGCHPPAVSRHRGCGLVQTPTGLRHAPVRAEEEQRNEQDGASILGSDGGDQELREVVCINKWHGMVGLPASFLCLVGVCLYLDH